MSLADVKDGGLPAKPDRPETYISPSQRKLYDSAVTFEEYVHYANRTREEEKAQQNIPDGGIMQQVFRRKSSVAAAAGVPVDNSVDAAEKEKAEKAVTPGANGHDSQENEQPRRRSIFSRHSVVSEEEWRNASRALRTASWGAGFYLITTDILGPYGVGFALGTLGWGPGVALYTVFAFMAGYSGYLLWQVYLGLDSYEYPLRNYVIIQNGQGISQTSKFRLCYVVCVVLFVIAGFFIGQVRTLRNFGVFSMVAVGLNLLVIFISMGVMAHSPPNYAISVLGSAGSAVNATTITPDKNGVYPAIMHYGGLPDSSNFVGAINGLMSGVFAYGGAQLFVEIMAEMRRPWDFIKAMWSAQFFIYSVYLIYGCYVYHYQGQYSFTIAYMGLSPYGFQAACDMLVVVSGLIAAGLYGNIGIKVLYNQVLQELFHAPPLTSKPGKYLFSAIVPVYWSVAFIVAAAIPDYFGFVSVIAAFCIVQFSYSFPPIIHLAYTMQRNSMRPGEGFNEHTGQTTRSDHGIKRLIKGFFADRWYINVWHIIHAGGALATAGLGAYAAIEGMIDAFKNPQINSFTCKSPLDLSAA
ncbi:hypothetical protein AYL99_01378 [Fonsecaea erecta]|uniref:Amino acid transporter transmembrane domain-containing protein n=1 Tax=Fonsecaea erecta TaxID=1367422 RepID=A0A179A1I5_9EURO|nr:hypothetical protein AYL99_01378 [Fonsecaea erecta]OAP65406.1 hypothetical protein AYL99_01378 [Fonsecaea erecta]